MIDKTKFYINGKWISPESTQQIDVINPSNEKAFAKISLGSEADTNLAVQAAKDAYKTWSTTSADTRVKLLERLLELYKAGIEAMAETISREMGAPIDLARTAQAGAGARRLEQAIRALRLFDFEHPLGDHAPDNMIRHEPAGVCALITPWNWPMNQIMLKVASALAAGCTVVLKPSEISPLSAMLLAEMIDEAGFPEGVFNLINGDGPGVGSQLSVHPDIDMLSFTGSTRAGKAITIAAADTVKRVSLELGGKGANVLFADADEHAVTRGVRHCFNNSGQSCNAPTRMLVEQSLYQQAIETAKAVADKMEVGPADAQGQHIGPVVSERQFQIIQSFIRQAQEEGATPLVGGTGRPEGCEVGYFVKPTIFIDVTPEMTIWKEEVFGPVLTITAFETEEEAVALANDTRYGLTNYIQTSDKERARRIARQLRSGMVEVNGKFGAPGSPFGGMKQSGNGGREAGTWGLEEFLEVKSVTDW